MLLFFYFLLMPTIVYADAGIKLTSNSLLEMLIILLLIIYIEALVYKSILKVNIKNTLLPSAISNLVSMIAGIPALLLVDPYLYFPLSRTLKKLFPALLIPYSYLDIVFNLIVAFFISVLIEYFIVKQFFKSVSTSKIKTGVWVGNIITYIMLFVIFFVSVMISIVFRF
ncbi:MAG: hypothetical protein COX13_03875 [Caldiserica bacterium CG23_combo_of_CG06-09_8_20_14_all_35_60]|nr:MAG: hypothetical protein COX13_03875 [Caldiserica bacterium CG23_combo_of_CG06-09_8_20_14_all_35_60]